MTTPADTRDNSAPAPAAAAAAFHQALTPVAKAAALLELVKCDASAAELVFATLPLDEQKKLVLTVAPDQRLELLHLPEDATALVQALPATELHRTVMTYGKWETQELVEVASEEQINFMLDHDCWRGEHLDSRKFTDWLQLFMECEDHQIFRILTAINADLLALALKKHVSFEKDLMIHDTYYLDPDWVKGSNPTVQEFLERLYALDPNLWIRLLGWVRTHSKPTIEADAIEGRESRLKGFGFPTATLAITVYYPVEYDIKGLVEGWRRAFAEQDAASATTALAGFKRDALFLERVFAQLASVKSGDETTDHLAAMRWETELVDIANKVMIADQVDIGDVRRQREAVDKVRRWISIGLETLACGHLENAVQILKDRRLEHCFRLGAMLFDALATAVVDLVKAEQRSGGRLVSSEVATVYMALIEPEPMMPDPKGFSRGHFIATQAEFRHAWNWLWRLTALLRAPAPARHPAPPPADVPGPGAARPN